MARSHFDEAPWTVILSDDKKRARIAAVQSLLLAVDYKGRNKTAIGKIDDKVGGRLKEILSTFKQKMGYGAKS